MKLSETDNDNMSFTHPQPAPARHSLARRFASIVCIVASLTVGPASANPAQDPEILTKAFAAQDAKDWSGAKSLVAQQPQILRELVEWRYVSTSGSGATFDEIDTFLNRHPNWPGRGPIIQRGEDALLSENLLEAKASAWFKTRPPRTSAACLAYAKYQFAHEQRPDALAGLKRCWQSLTLNMTDYQDWVTTTNQTFPEEDHLARADTLLWNRNVSGVKELLPLLSSNANTTASARISIQQGNPIDLEDALDAAPHPRWAAALLFDQAVQLRKAGKPKDSWPLLLRADDTGALSLNNVPLWWPEHNLSARAALDIKEAESAYKLSSKTRITPETNVTAYLDSEFLAGWIALRNISEPKKALTHFQNIENAARAAVSRARGAYWKTLAFKALGDDAKAKQSLAKAASEPTTFYGRLAFELQADPRATTPQPSTPTPANASENSEDLFQAVEALLLSKDTRRANAFANAAIELCKTTGCATTLSARLSKLGHTYGALRSAKKAQTLGVSRADQLYPLLDLPESCTKTGVPPSLILALIRQETEFDPTAISTANARGLMQLLPSTAQDVARRYSLPYSVPNDLLQPDINLALGCHHVKDLLAAFGGSYVLTIASYNAGRSRITGWMTTRGDPRDTNVDVIDWIESIPFDETRNYVMRVFENELAYKARLGDPLQMRELNLDLRHKL